MPNRVWAGLDIGVETTSLCVIDDAGQVLQSAVCPTALKDVHRTIRWLRRRRRARVGAEAGVGVSLVRGLRSLGYSIELYETRQLSKFLRTRRNKTDAGDANGIAEAGRVGANLISRVHLKSLESEALSSRLAMRRHLIKERVAAVNLICRQIELFGGRVSRRAARKDFREIVEAEMKRIFGRQVTSLTMELRHLLTRCEMMIQWQHEIDQSLAVLALENDVCRRFMAIPGVGPICALTFYAAVDEPHRFQRSTDVGSYFGLAPRLHQSGLTTRPGRISRMGNRAVRSLLVQAGMHFMKSRGRDSDLGSWVSVVEQRRGASRARVALARKLAVVMLTMWKAGTEYEPKRAAVIGEAAGRSDPAL